MRWGGEGWLFAFLFGLAWFLIRHAVGQTKIKVKNGVLLVPSYFVVFSFSRQSGKKLEQTLQSAGPPCGYTFVLAS